MLDRPNRSQLTIIVFEAIWELVFHFWATFEGLGDGELVAFAVGTVVHGVEHDAVWLFDWVQKNGGGQVLSLIVVRDSVSGCSD